MLPSNLQDFEKVAILRKIFKAFFIKETAKQNIFLFVL